MSGANNVLFQKKVEGIIVNLMAVTNSQNVIMSDGRTLADAFAGFLTETEQNIDDKINALVDGAPAAFDTLKEIADYIAEHEDVVDALNAAIGNKVDKVDGKGLSSEDFTTVLKDKLEALENYTHPLTHSAEMIEETDDRKFVTADEKIRIANAGRFIIGTEAPADLTENDLFAKIMPD